MAKFLFTLALFVLTYQLLAQNIEVDYAVRINRRSPSNSTETRYHLKIKGQESVYFNTLEDSVSRFIFASVQDIEREGARLMAKLDDSHYTFIEEDFLYKNYASSTMEYNEDIQFDLVVIKDPLARFDWQLLPDRDTTILGYPCQRARAEFRGRTYVACFSPALHPFGGPWKFEGLPGLILQVQSEDNYFIINPVKITLNNPDIVIHNPYVNANAIRWEDYVSRMEAYLKKQLKKLKAISEAGDEGAVSFEGIEDLGIGVLSFKK